MSLGNPPCALFPETGDFSRPIIPPLTPRKNYFACPNSFCRSAINWIGQVAKGSLD